MFPFFQWCSCSGSPLNSAAADLLPIWCHPLFWCILKASQEGCSWSSLKDVAVPKVFSKVWVMLKVPQRCGCSKRIPKGCGCTLHLSYTLKTLYFFIPSNSLFPAKDDAALHLQNLATTAPSRFSKVSTRLPQRGWISGESTNSHCRDPSPW